jgi:hypothetical protein
MKARRVAEKYLYSFFSLSARWEWVVKHTSRSLYPQEWSGTHCAGGSVAPRRYSLPPGAPPLSRRYTDYPSLPMGNDSPFTSSAGNTVSCSFSFPFLANGVGRDSSLGTATRYGLDGPGVESPWRRNFPHPPRPIVGPTQSPVQWVPGLFPGGKEAWAWR